MKKMIKSIIVLLIVILSISLVSASEVLNLKFDVNDDGTLNFLSSEVSGYEYIEGNAIFGAIDINDIDQGDITYSGDLFYDQGNLALFLGNANWQDKDYDSACYINLVNSNIECLYVEGGKVGNEINVNKLTQEANGFNTMKVLNFEQVKMDLENVEDEFDVLQDNSLITKLYIEGEMIDNEIFVGDLSIQNLDITDGNYFGICFVGNEADCYVTLKEEFVPEPIVSLSSLFCDYLDCGELLNVKLDENGENLDFISMEESVGSSVEGDLSLNLISEDEVKGNILFSGNWILNSNGNEYFYGDSDVVYDGNEYDDVLTFCIINYPNLDCGFSLEEGENSGVLVASLEHIGSGLDIKEINFEKLDIIKDKETINVNGEGTLTADGYFLDDFFFGNLEMDDGEVTDVYDGVCEINDMINCYVSLKEETFNEVIVVNEPNTGESNNYDSSNPGSNPGNSGDNSGSPDGHGTCYEEWKCTEWTECSNGFRIRSCSDLSLCNTENFKPDLEEPCEAEEETEEGNLITGAVVGASGGSWGAIIAGLVVLVVGIAGSLVYFRRNSFSY